MFQRNYPIGPNSNNEGTDFRVWAPAQTALQITVNGRKQAMNREKYGYFAVFVAGAKAGDRYSFEIDGKAVADPASRYQPSGPSGPSEITDPSAFAWTDGNWRGLEPTDHVLYELHVGTFTQAGTWKAATDELAELYRVGIRTIELMPVSDFFGEFGWGYDGVNLFAPHHAYGTPDDMKAFIDRAHALGMAVILDVVYNHLGPGGEPFMQNFSVDYFSKKHKTDWGEALNFDGDNSAGVREFVLENVRYWIEEFHLDGLRLDATQNIYDDVEDETKHILAEVVRVADEAGRGREIFVVMENESQNTKLLRPVESGGYGMTAAWNDDFHHSAVVAMTGRNEAYYTDYEGRPQEFISAAKYGYLYQGQYYDWQKNRRGRPGLDLPHSSFINFIENHDQIANSGRGYRVNKLTSAGRYRAVSAMLLLFPQIPLLFQGQEFASSQPFYYFADRRADNGCEMIAQGRKKELAQFPSLATPEMQDVLQDPCGADTISESKLNFDDRTRNAGVYKLYEDLLAIRNAEPIFRKTPFGFDGSVLADEAFLLRYFTDDGTDRLLIVNLGRDLNKSPAPDPLLAPPLNRKWVLQWSSEDPKYGGSGTPALEGDFNWKIPGHATILLKAA